MSGPSGTFDEEDEIEPPDPEDLRPDPYDEYVDWAIENGLDWRSRSTRESYRYRRSDD